MNTTVRGQVVFTHAGSGCTWLILCHPNNDRLALHKITGNETVELGAEISSHELALYDVRGLAQKILLGDMRALTQPMSLYIMAAIILSQGTGGVSSEHSPAAGDEPASPPGAFSPTAVPGGQK